MTTLLYTSHYRIIAIGRIRRWWIQEGINLYLRRLPGLTITELRGSTLSKEAEGIMATFNNRGILTALAEEGETLTSKAFAQRLVSYESQRLTFLIGGAEGLSPKIKAKAQWKLSLSPMTLPHELARLMLVEQLFRAQSIIQNSPYHRSVN